MLLSDYQNYKSGCFALNPSILDGKKVVGSEGNMLGEVEGIDIDINTWQATAFYVSLNDEATAELELKKPFLSKITICLPTQLVKAVGELITLKEPLRRLEDLRERGIETSPVKLKGKKVIGAEGYVIGEVEGFDVELSDWKVTGLQVGLTDDAATKLGFKRPFLSKVVIIIPSTVVSLVGNFVTLNKSAENLESLAECIRSCQKAN
jgi:sporulation protein YlmC with PRC-barrel domain